MTVIDEPLVFHVKHSQSTMANYKASKVRQIFQVIDYSLDFYKKKGWFEEYKEELEYFCVRVLLCSSMQRICKVSNRKERKALVKETLEFLEKNFKYRNKNKYFKKGLQNVYIKTFNRISAPLYTVVMRLKGKLEREYI